MPPIRRRPQDHDYSPENNKPDMLGPSPRGLPIRPRGNRDLSEILQPEPPARTPEHDQFMVTHAFRSEIEDYPAYQYRTNASNTQYGDPSYPNLWNPQIIQLQIEQENYPGRHYEEQREHYEGGRLPGTPLITNPVERNEFAAINQYIDPNQIEANQADITKQEEFNVARVDVVGPLDHTAQPGFLAKIYSDLVSSGTLPASSPSNNNINHASKPPFNLRQARQVQRRGKQRYQNRRLHRRPIARRHNNRSRIRRTPEQGMQDEHDESQPQSLLDRLQYCCEERSALLQHVTNMESAWNYQDFRLQRDIDNWRRDPITAGELNESRRVRPTIQDVNGSDMVNRNNRVVPDLQHNTNEVDEIEDSRREQTFGNHDTSKSP